MIDLLRGFLFLRFFSVFLSLFVSCANANSNMQSLAFHTDDPEDFEFFKSGKIIGMSTATNSEVLSRLDYQFEFAYMTTSRSMQFMDKGENVCMVSRIKTPERAAKYIFSDVVNFYLTKQLFQSNAHPPLPQDMLDEFGAVYLPDVFKRFKNRTLVYSTHITQGVGLDKQLDLIPQRNKIVRNGIAHEVGSHKMFSRDRADYILMFPQALIEGYDTEQGVRSYPIARAPMYQTGHFMCADNAFMRSVVGKLNGIIAKLHQTNVLFDTHLKWLRKEDKALFTRLYHKAITKKP